VSLIRLFAESVKLRAKLLDSRSLKADLRELKKGADLHAHDGAEFSGSLHETGDILVDDLASYFALKYVFETALGSDSHNKILLKMIQNCLRETALTVFPLADSILTIKKLPK
jgi:hypothetical protein